jgi:hypothetical protein
MAFLFQSYLGRELKMRQRKLCQQTVVIADSTQRRHKQSSHIQSYDPSFPTIEAIAESDGVHSMRIFCKPTRDHDALYPPGKVPGMRKNARSIDQGLLPRGEFYGRRRDSAADTASLSSLSSDDDSSVHSSTLEKSSVKADWRLCFETNKHTQKMTRRRSSLSKQRHKNLSSEDLQVENDEVVERESSIESKPVELWNAYI